MLEYDGLPDFSRQVESRSVCLQENGRRTFSCRRTLRKRWTLERVRTGDGLEKERDKLRVEQATAGSLQFTKDKGRATQRVLEFVKAKRPQGAWLSQTPDRALTSGRMAASLTERVL